QSGLRDAHFRARPRAHSGQAGELDPQVLSFAPLHARAPSGEGPIVEQLVLTPIDPRGASTPETSGASGAPPYKPVSETILPPRWEPATHSAQVALPRVADTLQAGAAYVPRVR